MIKSSTLKTYEKVYFIVLAPSSPYTVDLVSSVEGLEVVMCFLREFGAAFRSDEIHFP